MNDAPQRRDYNGHINWQMVGALSGILIAAGGVGWFMITRDVQATISPFQPQISSHDQAIHDIIERVRGLETRQGEAYAANIATQHDLAEVETQFRAEDKLRNLMQAEQLRTDGLLWFKVYGTPFPDTAYFPEMAKGSAQ